MHNRLLLIAVLAAASRPAAAALQVVSTSPVRHTFAPAGTTIAVTFDQPLMHSSVTSSSFRVFGKATGPIAGAITFSNGLTYRNHDASPSGTTALTLKEGLVDGQASIVAVGKGIKLHMPDLSVLTGPVAVQLHRSGGGPCFGATFSAPFQKHDATLFKDMSD